MYKIIGTTKKDKHMFYLSSMPGISSGIGFSKDVMKSYSFTSVKVAKRFLHMNKKALLNSPERIKHIYAVDNNGNWVKLTKLSKKKKEKKVA